MASHSPCFPEQKVCGEVSKSPEADETFWVPDRFSRMQGLFLLHFYTGTRCQISPPLQWPLLPYYLDSISGAELRDSSGGQGLAPGTCQEEMGWW